MKGKVGYDAKSKRYYVPVWDKANRKTIKIYHYKGIACTDSAIATKLLHAIQGDKENGTFRLEKYVRNEYDVVPYLKSWLANIRPTISKGTHRNYGYIIENHLAPFFLSKRISLHEIKLDILMELMNSMSISGSSKLDVLACLHTCLKYAWRSERIPSIPPFPERKDFQIIEPTIHWLPEQRQLAVIDAIPKDHQPIFMWLKYHLRRPAEAMALQTEDFDGQNFLVHRTVSCHEVVDRTKTHRTTLVPCVSEFRVYAEMEQEKRFAYGILSRFYFVNPEARNADKRYSVSYLIKLWKDACAKVGENINLYAGLKHSSCSQLINEYGYSMSDVQQAVDHRNISSTRQYAKVEVSRRREILEKKVIDLHNVHARSNEAKHE